MVNVKKRKGRVVIDSDSEDSASDDNLDQVGAHFSDFVLTDRKLSCQQFKVKLMCASWLRCVWPRLNKLREGPSFYIPSFFSPLTRRSFQFNKVLGFLKWSCKAQKNGGHVDGFEENNVLAWAAKLC